MNSLIRAHIQALLLAALVITILLAVSCGGSGGPVDVRPPREGVSSGATTVGADLPGQGLIESDEFTELPGWQQKLLSDGGWSQPYIEPQPGVPLKPPTTEMLMAETAKARQRAAESASGVAPSLVRSLSWNDQGSFDPLIPVAQGELPPPGGGTDPVIAAGFRTLPEVISYVEHRGCEPNYFNYYLPGSGLDANSAAYQLFADDVNADPLNLASTNLFEELAYRADLGVGGTAYNVAGRLWRRFCTPLDALPEADPAVALYNVLIAPTGDLSALLLSSPLTTARYQEFYFGTIGPCTGGAWLIGLESSSSVCDKFNDLLADSLATPSLQTMFVNPTYGVILQRWLASDLNGPLGGDTPWASWLGWPVLGPIAYGNGAEQADMLGPYYIWGMWFERGYIWWVDRDQNLTTAPDEAQAYYFTGEHIYCPEASDSYNVVPPRVYYGGTGPLGATVVAEAVSYTDASGPYSIVPTNDPANPTYYQVALPAGDGLAEVWIALHAQGYGGTPRAADCLYKHYVWAFRDGTIQPAGVAYDQLQAHPIHRYGDLSRNMESVYVVRVQVTDALDQIAYADSLPIHIGHRGPGGGFAEYDDEPEIVMVALGCFDGSMVSIGSRTWTYHGGVPGGDEYPDQSSTNVYRTTDPGGNYVITSTPNNDWINGNDVDFQFPWYAYIEDPDLSLVAATPSVSGDESVHAYSGLLTTASATWTRVDPNLAGYIDPLNAAWAANPIGALAPVAGYYVAADASAAGPSPGAHYGGNAASLYFTNDTDTWAECVAHWPPGFLVPQVWWSMFPGHDLLVPGGGGAMIPWDASWEWYQRVFDVDPSVASALRDSGDIWNRPQFAHTSLTAEGRVVGFDYTAIDGWDGDLNHDGFYNELDKFPVRCRLLVDLEDMLAWGSGWPDHLYNPGLATGADWPGLASDCDFVEGGTYVVDTGPSIHTVDIYDDPAEPNPEYGVTVVPGAGANEYDVSLYFGISYGTPPYTVELDADYDPAYAPSALDCFGMNDPAQVYVLDSSPYGAGGYIADTVTITQANSGSYLFALRVTDSSGVPQQDVFWYGNPVTLGVPGTDWVHTWGGGTWDHSYGVTSDSSGNVYVTGRTWSFGAGEFDALLLKYDSSGSLQWQRTWGGINTDEAVGVAVDFSGNIFVTGRTYNLGAGSWDAFLLCYDSSGALQWQQTWGGSSGDSAWDVAVDTSGNIYATGYTSSFGAVDYDAFLLCYNNSGTLQWQRTWGSSDYDYAIGVTADTSGNVYTTGFTDSFGAGGFDAFLLCYDSSGNLQWQRTWGGSSFFDRAYGVAADTSGNVYITGYTDSFGAGGRDAFLLKYDNAGSLQWQRTWGGSGSDQLRGIAVDAGNVYATGWTTILGSTHLMVLKYDAATGNLLDQQAWVHPSYSGDEYHCTAIAPDGGILFSGYAPSITGASWQAVSGTIGTPAGTATTPAGTAATPPGIVTTPSGTVTSPVGVQDIGGGGDDALVGKRFFPTNQPPVADLQATPTTGALPLTVSFDGTGSFDPDGVIVDYEWDFDGDGLFNEAGDEAAAQGSPTASSTYTTYGTFNPSLRVTDDGGATDTDTVGILVLSPPVADLQASPTSGGIPLLVSFDATGSYDPDGIIVDYEWDLDGDGIFNEAGIEAMSQGSATTSYGYASPGTFLATVRVTDNDALTDTDSVTISVNPSGWTITAPNPDDNGMTGMHSSLAIINGNPAISYYDFNSNDGNLMYVRATDASGTAWGVPEVVDSTGDVGLWCSLAEVNGHAAISYYDGTNGHLVYTYWDGATWQRITVEDESFIPAGSRSGAGQYSSLAVVSGQPAIAYFHATIGRLMFWRASDVDGSTWPTLMRESVDWPTSADPYSKGMDTSLKIVSGNPAISYYHTRGYLKYARAADAAGSDWTTGGGGIVVTVDGSRKTGMYTSLEVVNGQPAISYYRLYEIVFPIGTQYRRDLRYVRASDATGSAWGAPLTVDDGGMADDNVGMYCSMTVVDGNPAIAYQDTTHGYLCYIRATNNTGSAWGFRELLDTSGFVGAYACMKIVNGEPAVSYHDASNGSLKYIRKNP